MQGPSLLIVVSTISTIYFNLDVSNIGNIVVMQNLEINAHVIIGELTMEIKTHKQSVIPQVCFTRWGFFLNSCPNVEDQFNFPLIFLYICEFQLTYHYRLKIGGIRNRTLVAFFK